MSEQLIKLKICLFTITVASSANEWMCQFGELRFKSQFENVARVNEKKGQLERQDIHFTIPLGLDGSQMANEYTVIIYCLFIYYVC